MSEQQSKTKTRLHSKRTGKPKLFQKELGWGWWKVQHPFMVDKLIPNGLFNAG